MPGFLRKSRMSCNPHYNGVKLITTDNSFKDDLRKSYDINAELRDFSITQDWKITERAAFFSLLQREEKNSLLEIGAGHGRDSKFFHDQGLEVVCVDLSPEMVGLCLKKGLTAYEMDMTDLQFPDNSFDAVFSLNSLLHLTGTELPAVLQRISEIMKPRGLFYLGIFGGYDFEGVRENDIYTPKRFYSYYSDDNIRQIVTGVFDLLSFSHPADDEYQSLHFHSMTLRKKDG
ncbi:class I SAM-dependent methyltransferase [Chloroflexota bacterium]